MWLGATILGRGIFGYNSKAALLKITTQYNYPQLVALKHEKLEK